MAGSGRRCRRLAYFVTLPPIRHAYPPSPWRSLRKCWCCKWRFINRGIVVSLWNQLLRAARVCLVAPVCLRVLIWMNRWLAVCIYVCVCVCVWTNALINECVCAHVCVCAYVHVAFMTGQRNELGLHACIAPCKVILEVWFTGLLEIMKICLDIYLLFFVISLFSLMLFCNCFFFLDLQVSVDA